MTRDDLRFETTALLDIITRRTALRGAAPSGQPVSLAMYLAATQAMIATGGQPGRAQQAAVRAWLQVGADLTEADRARWAATVGARIAARAGRVC